MEDREEELDVLGVPGTGLAIDDRSDLILGSHDGTLTVGSSTCNVDGSHRRLKRHSRTLGQASMMSYEDTTETGETMRRLNFLRDDPWDEVNDDLGIRVCWFGHPFGADMLGASLLELLPRAPDGSLHMHYGVEEMFFVLSGTPTVRTPDGEEQPAPGDVIYFAEGRDQLH